MTKATTRKLRGQRAHYAGQAAEHVVAADYARRGCQLAHQRWRGPAGEIDLIARDGATVIFIEVKQARDFDRAAQSLSARQCARLAVSAEAFLADEPAGSLTEARFDVALVNGAGALHILENAIHAA
ncbi:MAG: YraN family protein [Marinibacterium sp.]|nr:YraN family protein [Marinibacterium sp.]